MTPEKFRVASNQRFADNEVMKIRPAHFRAFADDIRTTFVPQQAPNVPAYDLNYFYPEDYLVVFDGLYYRSKQAGVLPAPTPGQETPEWKPDLKPLSPVLAYHELPVQQGIVCSRDGQLEPSALYRFTGRVDAGGAPLPDVVVAAVSRYRIAEADAYLLRIDPLNQAEVLAPVSYDLLTDTTSPRTGGGGGVVDAYTKDETDTLLAGKVSKQELADLIGAAPGTLDTIYELAAELEASEATAAGLLATQQQQGQQLKDLQAATVPDLSNYYTKGQGDARYQVLSSAADYAVLGFGFNMVLDLAGKPAQLLTLTGNVSVSTTNRAPGRQLRLFLYNAASSDVTLSFASAWAFLGPRPSVLAAGKRAVLTLECVTGTTEVDIFAGYAAEL